MCEGLLTRRAPRGPGKFGTAGPTAGAQPWRREPLLMPLCRHSPQPPRSAHAGGDRAQRSTARSSSAKAPTLSEPEWHSRRPDQRHCGTGIWRDRDIAAGWRDRETPCASLPTQAPSRPPTAARKAQVLGLRKRSGRETDWPLEGDGFGLTALSDYPKNPKIPPFSVWR